MSPKITVIMPSFNVEPYIKKCLESVLAQTLDELQILCIDAASTDGTYEILKEYEKKDARIQVCVSEKRSYGAQVNMGIQMAEADYIGIVETDDFIDAEMYETLYREAEINHLDFIKGDYQNTYCREDGSYRFSTVSMFCEGEEKKWYSRVLNPREYPVLHRRGLNIWRGIYRKSFLLGNNIWLNETPGAAFQDTGFHHLVLLYGKRIMYIENPFYKYRLDRPESSFRNFNTLRYDYDEYQCLLRREAVRKRASQEELRFIYARMIDEFLIHYDKGVRMLAYDEDRLEKINEFASWFQKQIADGLDKQIIEMEDFAEAEWFKAMLARKSLKSYIDYIYVEDCIKAQRERLFCRKLGSGPVIIFGSGVYGGKALEVLKKNEVGVTAFCDNNPEKWNALKDGLYIKSPEECVHLWPVGKYIVAVKMGGEQIKCQLLSMGIDKGNIIDYRENI